MSKSRYVEWLESVVECLKKDVADSSDQPIIPLPLKNSAAAEQINKYVDEAELKELFSQGADPLLAAQTVAT